MEGWKILDKEEIHLAIVDIMMPVMDGITMTMKLREHYDFPVIMLSAKSEEIDKVTGTQYRGGRLCDEALCTDGAHGQGQFPASALQPVSVNWRRAAERKSRRSISM